MRLLLALVLTCCAVGSVHAEEIKVVLWNCQTLFGTETVDRRANDLETFGRHFADADVVILDEVTSLDVVKAARDKMGFRGYHAACSDFNQDDNDTFNSLEVGFISRFPLENVVEFDLTPDNTGAAGEPAERLLDRVPLDGIAEVAPTRGFLVADIPALGLTVLGTHLKSSGRGLESENAKKREYVAAAMARFVAGKLRDNEDATIVVAGDMNVGETDVTKNGYHLAEDNEGDAAGDRYDDTHAIFSAGLVDGLHMASLTKGIGGETYDSDRFAGSGPIDCIYVVGKRTADFTLARKTTQTFGSDHFAVSTRFLMGGAGSLGGDVTPGGGSGGSGAGGTVSPSGVRISALLPNPIGPDGGNEIVKLKNLRSDAVDLRGWKLRDKANNALSLEGTIAAGAEHVVRLPERPLSLNQNGDEVTLLNAAGQAVDKVSYTSEQVENGRFIRFEIEEPGEPEEPIEPTITTADFADVAAQAARLAQEHHPENVLLVFDIDNTLLAMKQDLGSVQWYNWQDKLPRFSPLSVKGDGLVRVQGVLFELGSMRLTQASLPTHIGNLQGKGFPTLLLTSRGPAARPMTIRELRRNGLDFASSAISPAEGYPGRYLPFSKREPDESGLTTAEVTRWSLPAPLEVSYSDGIYMTTGQHKGAMLRTLLHRSDSRVKAIVFTDDQPMHIAEMQEAFRGRDVDLVTCLFTAEHARARRFAASTEQQEEAASDWAKIRNAAESAFPAAWGAVEVSP